MMLKEANYNGRANFNIVIQTPLQITLQHAQLKREVSKV